MKKRLILAFILLAYCAILVEVIVFKNIPVIRIGSLKFRFGGSYEIGQPNLVPFKTIWSYLNGNKGSVIAGINLIGNVLLLVPIGFLAPFVLRKLTWQKSVAIAVATGLTLEVTQAILHVGIFDIDDVILNGLGVMIGYWIFTLLEKWKRRKSQVPA